MSRIMYFLAQCAHCGASPKVTYYKAQIYPDASRHVCEQALEDWVRLNNPNLYGWLMPYTPTMQIMTTIEQRKLQKT